MSEFEQAILREMAEETPELYQDYVRAETQLESITLLKKMSEEFWSKRLS